jgi:hypothetical protein
MDSMKRVGWVGTVVLIGTAAAALAQTPQPFPRPGGVTTLPPAPLPQPPPAPAPPAAPATGADQAVSQARAGEPTAASLGVPLYPSAQFIASFDAGRGQRYYLYGVTAPFAEMVTYYRTQLRDRGELVFEEPPTHMFEVGRFREETMAFPPGLTIKDWTFGGSQGYPNPRPGATPARFPTVLMIVPPPAPAPAP